MPRRARTVVEGIPYHITQRGNRKQDVFFSDPDREKYLEWLGSYSERYKLEILAYCLMTNHVHIVAIPDLSNSMAKTLQIIDTRHSQLINKNLGWIGHLWQGRFFSCALDDAHLWAAVKYIERNPVRAGMVKTAGEYKWSSAAFHLGILDDKLIKSDSIWGNAVENWDRELASEDDEDILDAIRSRTHTGFPCGDDDFVTKISEILNRIIIPRKQGRPKKER